jgi:hypothetical protein
MHIYDDVWRPRRITKLITRHKSHVRKGLRKRSKRLRNQLMTLRRTRRRRRRIARNKIQAFVLMQTRIPGRLKSIKWQNERQFSSRENAR